MPVAPVTELEFTQWLISYFPSRWFSNEAQAPGGGLYATAAALASDDVKVYARVLQFYNSITLTNAVGTQIDDIVKDYFGNKLPRLPGEGDAAYKGRAVTRLMLPVGTREGMDLGVFSVVGTHPIILENRDLANSCGWAKWTPGNKYTAQVYGDFAWNRAGRFYLNLGAYQALITVYQPEPTSPNFLTFDQIMALVNSLKPEATIMWTQVIGPPSTSGVPIH